jgi:hypothetical protein
LTSTFLAWLRAGFAFKTPFDIIGNSPLRNLSIQQHRASLFADASGCKADGYQRPNSFAIVGTSTVSSSASPLRTTSRPAVEAFEQVLLHLIEIRPAGDLLYLLGRMYGRISRI